VSKSVKTIGTSLSRWTEQFRREESGQTLVDLMIALALLSFAAASAGGLSTLTSRVNSESGRRSQAVALAAREVEAIRNYRDTGLAKGTNWDSMFPVTSGDCDTFYLTFDSSTNSWVYNPASTVPVSYTTTTDFPQASSAAVYEGFYRIAKACTAVSGDTKYKNVDINVYWEEGNAPTLVTAGSANLNRTVNIRTVLTGMGK
jgi:type II secretory pathway pseudopilin PulG